MVTIGSLFSGIGGIDIGFEQAGFGIEWAIEKDPAACKTYRYNFPNIKLIEKNIKYVSPELLSDVDVLTAGFPCQPFSIMGYQRGFADTRGNLFFEIAKFIDVKKPRIIFLENVSNLIRHDNGNTFLVIYNTLVELGYSVKYKVINATEFDIPQIRERIYIIAFREFLDCDRFVFPLPQPLFRTIDNIIDRHKEHDAVYYYNPKNKYYEQLNTKIAYKSGIYRIDDSGIAMRKWDICPTLKANMGTYHDRVPIIRDDYGIRKLTPLECLSLQGFPKDFKFKGISLNDAYKQCGNTVAVPVIRKIAEKIKEILIEK